MNPLIFSPPLTFSAGDSLNWKVEHPDYRSSDGWFATCRLRNSTASGIDLNSTAYGVNHEFVKSANDTDDWDAGEYGYRLQFIKDDKVITVKQGVIRILPSFNNDKVDHRTPAKIALDRVNELLSSKAGRGIFEYEIAGRRIRYETSEDLLKLQKHLVIEVEREKLALGLSKNSGLGGRILVRHG